MVNLTPLEIKSALLECGYDLDALPPANEEGWVQIFCPFHDDVHKESAGINVETGKIHCFAGCENSNVIQLYQEVKKLPTYNDAVAAITGGNPMDRVGRKADPLVERTAIIKKRVSKIYLRGIFTDLDPTKYEYTRRRGFTKEFIDRHGIKLCLSGHLTDYMVIPVINYEKDMEIYEARKVKEGEYLTRFFGEADHSMDEFEQLGFSLVKVRGEGDYISWVVTYPSDESHERYGVKEAMIRYLCQPKVLYPKDTAVKETIFNIDFLTPKKPLYLCEGTGSLPKLEKVFGSNCSCTFGALVKPEQMRYLNLCSELVVIPDPDKAGIRMVEKLYQLKCKTLVLPVLADDKEDGYEEALRTTQPVPINEYLVGKVL